MCKPNALARFVLAPGTAKQIEHPLVILFGYSAPVILYLDYHAITEGGLGAQLDMKRPIGCRVFDGIVE